VIDAVMVLINKAAAAFVANVLVIAVGVHLDELHGKS
jgi:hypothetical protein